MPLRARQDPRLLSQNYTGNQILEGWKSAAALHLASAVCRKKPGLSRWNRNALPCHPLLIGVIGRFLAVPIPDALFHLPVLVLAFASSTFPPFSYQTMFPIISGAPVASSGTQTTDSGSPSHPSIPLPSGQGSNASMQEVPQSPASVNRPSRGTGRPQGRLQAGRPGGTPNSRGTRGGRVAGQRPAALSSPGDRPASPAQKRARQAAPATPPTVQSAVDARDGATMHPFAGFRPFHLTAQQRSFTWHQPNADTIGSGRIPQTFFGSFQAWSTTGQPAMQAGPQDMPAVGTPHAGPPPAGNQPHPFPAEDPILIDVPETLRRSNSIGLLPPDAMPGRS